MSLALTTAVDAASVLADFLRPLAFELVTFTVTLAFALVIRKLNVGQQKVVGGKAASKPKTADSPPQSLRKKPSGSPLRCLSTDTCSTLAPSDAPRTPLQRRSSPQSTRSPPLLREQQVPQSELAAVMDEIVGSMKEQASLRVAGRALQLYHEELRSRFNTEGLRIKEVARLTKFSPVDLYTTLVHCAIRAGRHHLVESLVDDMAQQGVARPLLFYESAMKQLAGQKQYHLALAMYDRLSGDGLRASAVTCSCLIGFAAEVGELQRAVEFFNTLSEMTTPSIRAYMTVFRVHAKRQDFAASLATLSNMDKRNVPLDSLALNIVLATGVAADQLAAVKKLVQEADARSPPVTDVVSYNTLMKGCAQRADEEGAAKALVQMRARGLAPNAITFNTAMDATVRSGKSEGAWKLLRDMRSFGLRPDKFTCSILVKGLAKSPTAAQVQDMLQLLKEVDSACDSSLKTQLYHAVLEAASVSTGHGGGAPLAAKTFAQMRQHKVTPSATAQRLILQVLPGVSADEQ